MSIPLCVDLDGTLIHTDMLHETALDLLRSRPFDVFRLPGWLSQGKAGLKRRIAERVDIEAATLPYDERLVGWLRQQRESGRRLVLCTASDVKLASAIADHLGVFDEVMASDGAFNLGGDHKAEALVARFGEKGFDYAGNARVDLPVWKRARRAVVVNAPAAVAKQAESLAEVERVFNAPAVGLVTWLRMLRVHQWMKNALLFMPLLAAHQISDVAAWQRLLVAFLAFSLCASSVYIANDLLDLTSDRLHPRKCKRPFAAGVLPVWLGVLLAPALCGTSWVLAGLGVGRDFLGLLLGYFALTCIYSFSLKRVVLIDCLTLAMLYTLRIVAGGAAAGVPLSFWLLAFSVFLFLSLSFVKRFAELKVQLGQGKEKAHGRGYYTEDAPLVQSLGVASGFSAALVLALYLNSDAVLRLYASPQWVWGTVPILVFWISWVWLRAHRGEMHDDPVVFAVKDRTSLLAGLAFAATLLMGTVRW